MEANERPKTVRDDRIASSKGLKEQLHIQVLKALF